MAELSDQAYIQYMLFDFQGPQGGRGLIYASAADMLYEPARLV
jgi:hypothetical protein